MNSMHEVVGLLYVSLAIAAGGNDLLEDSNDILRTVIERVSISPGARQALKALVATTSKKEAVQPLTSAVLIENRGKFNVLA
jgi:hypothetical protein